MCRLTTKLSGADGSPRRAARAYPRPLQRLVMRRDQMIHQRSSTFDLLRTLHQCLPMKSDVRLVAKQPIHKIRRAQSFRFYIIQHEFILITGYWPSRVPDCTCPAVRAALQDCQLRLAKEAFSNRPRTPRMEMPPLGHRHCQRLHPREKQT